MTFRVPSQVGRADGTVLEHCESGLWCVIDAEIDSDISIICRAFTSGEQGHEEYAKKHQDN